MVVFWVYVALVLSATLFVFRGSPYAPLELNPIASYIRAANAPANLARMEIMGIALNIAMFVPLGLLTPILWRKMAKLHRIAALLAASTLFIETTQLLTARGVFSLEDMLHNTIGGLLGFFVFKILKADVPLPK
ncbi:MAG: VanZ family protein [Defluviitaleaceae bacterium]|nr:VanZ family protein [Defluviitaleaceae bacterium]